MFAYTEVDASVIQHPYRGYSIILWTYQPIDPLPHVGCWCLLLCSPLLPHSHQSFRCGPVFYHSVCSGPDPWSMVISYAYCASITKELSALLSFKLLLWYYPLSFSCLRIFLCFLFRSFSFTCGSCFGLRLFLCFSSPINYYGSNFILVHTSPLIISLVGHLRTVLRILPLFHASALSDRALRPMRYPALPFLRSELYFGCSLLGLFHCIVSDSIVSLSHSSVYVSSSPLGPRWRSNTWITIALIFLVHLSPRTPLWYHVVAYLGYWHCLYCQAT